METLVGMLTSGFKRNSSGGINYKGPKNYKKNLGIIRVVIYPPIMFNNRLNKIKQLKFFSLFIKVYRSNSIKFLSIQIFNFSIKSVYL